MNLKYLVIIYFFCFSCNTHSLKKKIEGTWAIEEVYMDGEYYTPYLLSNILTFRGNGSCFVPLSMEDKENDGNWTLTKISGKDCLTIEIYDNKLVGTYTVTFEKDYEKKLLKIILENDSKYIKASKMLHDFDANEK